ncbi:RNA polymerase sigma factor sigA [Acorus calamus]|uniref:RNA polymerase sigma factor sigA n=1 Tax=Acorus calamus TaxID=4465 RepID=A0AAV9E0Z7_ACOCL|nr:RNA polymerase sigma factor sigA [Acorus calamus]
MMAATAVIGVSAGKRLLSTSFYSSDLSDKLLASYDHGLVPLFTSPPTTKSVIVAKTSSDFGSIVPSKRHVKAIKAVKEHVEASTVASAAENWFRRSNVAGNDEESEYELSLEVLLLLQKSMLEKQWNLSFGRPGLETEDGGRKSGVTRSGVSARKRRLNTRRRCLVQSSGSYVEAPSRRKPGSLVSPELLQHRFKGYVKGTVSEDLLTHAEVVYLSKKIRAGLSLEEHKSRLRERLGCEPSDNQLASSLRISRAELHSRMIECSLAREKLAMSNVRLVMSIAQKYDNMGAELSDLIQGGLVGLLRGIEKFDSSKGFKISTYVYWWIRQGVSRALVENSRTLRLPTYLHERLSLIRHAKIKLEEKGITPSIDKIAESLNMSQKKVRNATEAVSKVISLDREAFPSLNGLPSETLHSYVADNNLENNPWQGLEEWSLKDEVNKLLNVALGERERDIIRLYYGLNREYHTWEDISRQIGLSRERVRQVGLVALEKLKHAARKRRLEAMLVKH